MLWILLVAMAFFAGFVGIKMATLDTEVTFTQTYAVPEFPELIGLPEVEDAQWAVAVDGVVVASSGSEHPRPTASTTKMILALAVMQQKPFKLGEQGETITISQTDYNKYTWQIAHGGSNTKVQVGENISEYDALAAVLVASSNNMADSLAEWAFGSHEEYQKYATQMLADIDVKNTTIGIDASGYDASTTATAADLAVIAERVLSQPVLAEIVAKEQAVVPVAGTLTNTNRLLGKHGIVGVKTGYIGEPSGYCLVTGYLEDEHIVTVAYLDAPTRAESFSASEEIVKKLQEQLTQTTLIAEGTEVGYYETWWSGKHPVLAEETVAGIGWQGVNSSANIADGMLQVKIANQSYTAKLAEPEFANSPSLWQRFLRVFGWEFKMPEPANDAPQSATQHQDEAPIPRTYTLSFTGDVSLADNWYIAPKYDERGGINGVLGETMLKTMRDSTLMVVNSEFTVSSRGTALPNKLYTFRAKPERLKIYDEMGVDLVSLANNHVYDYGREAFLDMLTAFNEYKIPYVGAGKDIAEAKKPYFAKVGDFTIAFVAGTRAEKNVMTPQATAETPGTFWCYDPAEMIELIKSLKDQADFIIPMIHFGRENSHTLEQAQMENARAYIDAGADVVVGHHAHVLQGVEIYKDKPIIYNLGNFLFNGEEIDTALFQIILNQDGQMDYYILPALQKDSKTILLEDGAKKQQIIDDINSWSINAQLDGAGKITKK